MSEQTFLAAVAFVLKSEGGYVLDPRDPGGETNFGISKRSYPDLDIKALTVDAATAIYRQDFWAAVRGDDMPAPVALLVFDSAVNQGAVAAVRMLQQAAGCTVDGVIGPHTLMAALKPGILEEFSALRAFRYGSHPQFPIFGKGWMRRLFAAHTAALLLPL